MAFDLLTLQAHCTNQKYDISITFMTGLTAVSFLTLSSTQFLLVYYE